MNQANRENSVGGILAGRYPATVESYDAAKRTCKVIIPSMTDGAEEYPVAQIEYPVGDKKNTELEIMAGDSVWISFIAGDQRYPIVTGYRNANAGNDVDWLRWHQKNISLKADVKLLIEGGTVELNGIVKINGVVQSGNQRLA